MLELPHVLVGAAIATVVRNPLISIPLALTSHLVLDEIPHWNPHIGSELKKFRRLSNSSVQIIIIDSSIALILGTFIASQALPDQFQFVNIMLCCLSGALPDLLEFPHFFYGKKYSLIEKLVHFQKNHQRNVPLLPGLLTQAVFIAASLLVIFQLK